VVQVRGEVWWGLCYDAPRRAFRGFTLTLCSGARLIILKKDSNETKQNRFRKEKTVESECARFVSSGHALASERVRVRHRNCMCIWSTLLTSERMRVKHGNWGQKTTTLRYISEQ